MPQNIYRFSTYKCNKMIEWYILSGEILPKCRKEENEIICVDSEYERYFV